MNDLVKLYNPANAAALTPAEIEGLQKLDSPQIKELAEAYPNSSIHHAYLLIIDSRSKLPVERQLPQLSTFENLWNLREKNAQRQWVAFGFRGTYKATPAKTLRPKASQVLDLSDVELLSLPGHKHNPLPGLKNNFLAEKISEPVTVKVTKIKKVVTEPIPVHSRNDKFIVEKPFEALPPADDKVKVSKPKAPRKTKSK